MSPNRFESTSWTMVLALQTTDGPRRAEALARLCEAYWPPIYAFVRRTGQSPEDAADLTQAFFLHLLRQDRAFAAVDPDLGRFRTFLLGALRHFLSNERHRVAALKRGGGWSRVPFEPVELERKYTAMRSASLDPERAFNRQWAATVLDRALARLRSLEEGAGRERQFAALRGYLTSETVEGDPSGYRAVAAELGTTETAVRAAVHRLRQRLGAALREEVVETVGDPSAADAELRHLLALLA
jgi:RNA polymerase sigma-70 factor (ECF subfamily)